MKSVIAYIPALHEGYIRFLKKHSDKKLFLIGDDIRESISKDIPYYGRDVRAVEASVMQKAITALGIVSKIGILGLGDISRVQKETELIVMPDEDISHEVASRFFRDTEVVFETAFLRWDKKISQTEYEVPPHRVVSTEEFHRQYMTQAFAEAEKSSDWWRQVGSLIVLEGKVVLLGYNKHMPEVDNPYVLGDPRSNFDAGVCIELSTALHGEAGLIAEAAKKGISLAGTSIYVTTFPCPNCAKLIAASGIKQVFYTKGYSLLDAEDILKSAGVEIVLVSMD